MAWMLLFVAGILEIGWAVGLKFTEDLTRPLPTVLTVASMVTSIGLLDLAAKTLRSALAEGAAYSPDQIRRVC